MNWFACTHGFLQDISESPRADLHKLVALLICLPCSQLSDLFFKSTYTFEQRHALILSRERSGVGINKLRLEFEELSLKGCGVAQPYHGFSNILCRLKRGQSAC